MARARGNWLEYSGQTTDEILAAKQTHRIDSLLFAIQFGLLRREGRTQTPEERLFLAVMALRREVNNGGYAQFFVNSSRQYVPEIVDALRRIGCEVTADLTARAIGNARRPEVLNACDKEFYQLHEIDGKLIDFVESSSERFILEKTSIPPPPPKRGFTNVSSIEVGLRFAKLADHSFDAVRAEAAAQAAHKEIGATDAEIEGAARLYLFGVAVHKGDLEACEAIALQAFALAWEDTTHCVLHKSWAMKLIEAGRPEEADAAVFQYFERLNADDKSSEYIIKRAHFFARLVAEHGDKLPRSIRFLNENFPAWTEKELQGPRIFRIGRKREGA